MARELPVRQRLLIRARSCRKEPGEPLNCPSSGNVLDGIWIFLLPNNSKNINVNCLRPSLRPDQLSKATDYLAENIANAYVMTDSSQDVSHSWRRLVQQASDAGSVRAGGNDDVMNVY